MSKVLHVHNHNVFCYDIMIEQDYSQLNQIFEKLQLSKRKVCVVSDTNSGNYYAETVCEIVKKHASVVETYIIPSGEEHKNLDTVQGLYGYLIQLKFDRKDILIALGGGVVGDLTGFVAATYLRGIDFIQMPTTLLSMTDSSVGGKTGVDYLAYKNMVGAFHQPKAVYINLSTIQTLPDKQYYSGFGEVIKYGLIKENAFYQWLKENRLPLLEKELSTMEEMVYRSCQHKQWIVEEDPKEQGERALLNFGHTLGHAIEKQMDFQYLHGECVALGMIAASYISWKKGFISIEEVEDIKHTIQQFHLPTTVSMDDLNPIIEITKNDKKMDSGTIKFILLKSLGNAYIDKTVTDEDMKEALSFLKK